MRARFTPRYWLPVGLLTVSGLALAVGVFGGACTTVDTTVAPSTIIGPGTTSVSVDPLAFLAPIPDGGTGPVICNNGPGGMESFVATITDVGRNFVLPSSAPTACTQSAYFEYITLGDSYTGVVDGYDLPPDQLVPECGLPGPGIIRDHTCAADADCVTAVGPGSTCQAGFCTCSADSDCPVTYGCAGQCILTTALINDAGVVDQQALLGECATTPAPAGAIFQCSCQYTAVEGSRVMYQKSTGKPYAPRWQTPTGQPCGAPLGVDGGVSDGGVVPMGDGVVSEPYVNVSIAPCAPLVDHGGTASITAVQVIPYAALGALTCAGGDGGGTVTQFAIQPADSSLPLPPNLACNTPAGFTFQQGVVAGNSYGFTIQAFEGGTTPTQQSCCSVTAQAGLTVTATCNPLVPIANAYACP